jgi:hypothetical protein
MFCLVQQREDQLVFFEGGDQLASMERGEKSTRGEDEWGSYTSRVLYVADFKVGIVDLHMN